MFLLTVTVARRLDISQVGYHKFHFYEVRGFRARHRRRREDNIKMDLLEVGWGEMGWTDLDQDRESCRRLFMLKWGDLID
jgi:hypothetical protein